MRWWRLNTAERKGLAAALGLVVLVAGGMALYRPIRNMVRDAIGFQVPAQEGKDRCQVRFGDSRDSVVSRCGPPCNSGGVPKGECPDDPGRELGFISFCSWDCDLYRDVWVCYCGSGVIDVGADLHVVHSGTCYWPGT